MSYQLYVNDTRTVLVRIWDAHEDTPTTVEVATRETPDHTWGPPVWLTQEKT